MNIVFLKVLFIAILCLFFEWHGRSMIQSQWDIEKAIANEKLDAVRKHINILQKTIRENADAKQRELATLAASRDAAVAKLRLRPRRRTDTTTNVVGKDRQCAGASGAELSGEDAVFLAREAARADQYVIELNQCHADYEAVRLTSQNISMSSNTSALASSRVAYTRRRILSRLNN